MIPIIIGAHHHAHQNLSYAPHHRASANGAMPLPRMRAIGCAWLTITMQLKTRGAQIGIPFRCLIQTWLNLQQSLEPLCLKLLLIQYHP